MESFTAGDLTIAVEEGATLLLNWLGKSNDRQPGKLLEPFFEKVLDAASTRSVPVHMHFDKLEYFNSSTISSLIQVIQKARSKNVKLVIQYNATIRWQKLSFDALRVFAKGDDLLELRTIQ